MVLAISMTTFVTKVKSVTSVHVFMALSGPLYSLCLLHM